MLLTRTDLFLNFVQCIKNPNISTLIKVHVFHNRLQFYYSTFAKGHLYNCNQLYFLFYNLSYHFIMIDLRITCCSNDTLLCLNITNITPPKLNTEQTSMPPKKVTLSKISTSIGVLWVHCLETVISFQVKNEAFIIFVSRLTGLASQPYVVNATMM